MRKNKKAKINQVRARVEVECAKRGWTIAELGRRCGRSPQAMNDVLSRQNPRLQTIKELADVLGISVADFFKVVTTEEYGRALMPNS
jgi:lambda repressor-like predicted transcriptional regulator